MRISDWSSDVCSSDLGQPRLLVADQDREVLGHVAALHGVDADLFQSLGELLQLRRAVELAAIPETTGPGEDRRDRVRGSLLALLVLAVVTGHCTVRRLGPDRPAVRRHPPHIGIAASRE